MKEPDFYVLMVYVPSSHLDCIKQALFAQGAGRLGHYRACCWQVAGQGQFVPDQSAKPMMGKAETLTQLEEYRIEMVVPVSLKCQVRAALLSAHPYETPAYHFIKVET